MCHTWEKFSSLPAKKRQKFETATRKKNFQTETEGRTSRRKLSVTRYLIPRFLPMCERHDIDHETKQVCVPLKECSLLRWFFFCSFSLTYSSSLSFPVERTMGRQMFDGFNSGHDQRKKSASPKNYCVRNVSHGSWEFMCEHRAKTKPTPFMIKVRELELNFPRVSFFV